LFVGLALHVETQLIIGIVAFTVFAAVANHLWERQFFVERSERSYFLENAVMNNFLGWHYFVALLKALVSPNTPFSVTAKSGVGDTRGRGFSAFLWLSCVFVTVDVTGLVAAWLLSLGSGLRAAQVFNNFLLYPLLLAAAANILVLLFSSRLQRQGVRPESRRLRAFASNLAARDKSVEEIEREQIVSEPQGRFSHA
jgi:hypothetical protein